MTSWQEVTAQIAARCKAGGLDLVQPLAVGWYNEAVESAYQLPDFGNPDRLALCIGNSRAMWEPFLEHVSSLAEKPSNPVDDYAEYIIAEALGSLASSMAVEVRYAPEPPPRRVALQRLAKASGLADLAPSYLCVHPEYGPWIGLRAAIVLDVSGPRERPAPTVRTCDCTNGCAPALERALAARGDSESMWRVWVAVRDACPMGSEHRYSERQIRYHYTKNRDLL